MSYIASSPAVGQAATGNSTDTPGAGAATSGEPGMGYNFGHHAALEAFRARESGITTLGATTPSSKGRMTVEAGGKVYESYPGMPLAGKQNSISLDRMQTPPSEWVIGTQVGTRQAYQPQLSTSRTFTQWAPDGA